MKIKLDENLSRHLASELCSLGHDAETCESEGLSGLSDEVVGAVAAHEGRVLLTLDIEFADLRKHPPGRHPGIVLFRPRSRGAIEVKRFVLDFARQTDLGALQGCIAIVEPIRVRVRRPVIEGGI